jgi:hypothetical protein
MDTIWPIAGAVLVFLEVAGAISKKTERLLPIGGSHIVQLAIVFGLAYVVYELMSVLR